MRGGPQWESLCPERVTLESVFQRELNGAIIADRSCDLSEIGVSHAVIWIGVVSDVEGVEQIRAEVHAMLMPERKALENSHVDVLETRLAQ